MNYPYSAKINDGPEMSLQDLGLSLLGLELHNMQADTASLRWTRVRAADASPLRYDDQVDLIREGVRLFRGWARPGSFDETGGPISLAGPWEHELEEVTFQYNLFGIPWPRVGESFEGHLGGQYPVDEDTWAPLPDDVTWTWGTQQIYVPPSTTGTLNLNYYFTSRMWMFAPDFDGYLTVAEQMGELLIFLEEVSETFALDVLQLGANASPKMRTVADLLVGEAIRQTLRAKPDAACWYDYSGPGNPTLNIRVARLETPLTYIVGSTEGQIMPDYKLRVASELKPKGIVLRWEADTNELTGTGTPYLVDQYPPDTVCYDRGVLVQTLTEDTAPRVGGIAEELYKALAVTRAVGSVRVLDPDFSQGLRPGMTLYVQGDAELAGVQLWVQAVQWDASTGIATLQVGYPRHLNLQERLDLRGWLRCVFYVPGALVSQILLPPA